MRFPADDSRSSSTLLPYNRGCTTQEATGISKRTQKCSGLAAASSPHPAPKEILLALPAPQDLAAAPLPPPLCPSAAFPWPPPTAAAQHRAVSTAPCCCPSPRSHIRHSRGFGSSSCSAFGPSQTPPTQESCTRWQAQLCGAPLLLSGCSGGAVPADLCHFTRKCSDTTGGSSPSPAASPPCCSAAGLHLQ